MLKPVLVFGSMLVMLSLSPPSQSQAAAAQRFQADALPRPDSSTPLYRHTGEQYKVYEFPGTGESIPYRLFVPEDWAPDRQLPVLVTLRAGTSINNNHRNDNDLVREARARGYIVISPMGYRPLAQPYYGSPYPVDRPTGPSVPGLGWSEEENLRAELDVLYVLELVGQEYGIDRERVFIHGQNPSSSGAFHLVAKYPEYFRGIIASAGPIITDDFPFAALQGKSVLMIHGDRDTQNTVEASQRVTSELQAHGIDAVYATVPGGEHLTAYLTYAREIFDFLDQRQ